MSTPSQTIGPFFAIGLPWVDGVFVVPASTPDGVWIRGVVTDGAGDPVPDALVETWQADARGVLEHPDDPRGPSADLGFRGFGRCPTDSTGRFEFWTVKPGIVDGQAPHMDVSVFARGLLQRVVTRIYFADEPAANAADPVLAGVDAPRRATLLAAPVADGYHFDIRLQGDRETVFFDL